MCLHLPPLPKTLPFYLSPGYHQQLFWLYPSLLCTLLGPGLVSLLHGHPIFDVAVTHDIIVTITIFITILTSMRFWTCTQSRFYFSTLTPSPLIIFIFILPELVLGCSKKKHCLVSGCKTHLTNEGIVVISKKCKAMPRLVQRKHHTCICYYEVCEGMLGRITSIDGVYCKKQWNCVVSNAGVFLEKRRLCNHIVR